MDYQTHCGRCAASLVGERAPSVATTISQHIDIQVNRLSLEHLTSQEREWLHGMRTLAMWSYIAKYRRKHSKLSKGA